METTKEEYEFCRQILDNHSKYNHILKTNKGCNHDRSKERELYERPTCDKLNAIRLFCDEGNIKYRNNQIEKAILEYKNALIYVDYTFPETKTLEDEYNQLITRIHLNLSACFLKINVSQVESVPSLLYDIRLCLRQINIFKITQEFNMAILHCNKVLKNDPNNTKALYRLSQAYINIYEYNKALEIIENALNIGNDGKSAFIKLKNDILLLETRYKNSNCEKYKKLFNN